MDTFTDASYLDTLNGKPYMMGVSPWIYTNMPGFRKNWLWRGDSLVYLLYLYFERSLTWGFQWFDRWISVLFLQPEYVQIITWNDYGESHYIGPLRDKAFEAFGRGKSPYNYAAGKNHNAWRSFLPFLIDMAKTNATTFDKANFIAWYRPYPVSLLSPVASFVLGMLGSRMLFCSNEEHLIFSSSYAVCGESMLTSNSLEKRLWYWRNYR
jgi:hypothetical protein